VSGRGSNLQALLAAFPPDHPLVQISCVIGNRPDCAALGHARRAGVLTHSIARQDYPSREAQHTTIAERLADAGAQLVVLAGYDQVLTAPLLTAYAGRLINVHPSLLPAFAGTLHAPAEALRYGVKVSGCTVHYVTAEVDGGPIIAQAAVPVLEDDDEASLSARILEQEHWLLPQVVCWLAEGRVHLQGRRVHIDGVP
ncbi:MAG TPA: phosphoribosylglycinamide formyltransferase, partial [Chloroflexota bacterium]|nr:phosphoribosylglycinamide formyltransferase [Chloroflexota bacterium]